MDATETQDIRCKTFFLDGIGGSGKTYLYKCLIHKLRREGKTTIAVASSGLAAMLLPYGTTGHKMFKIPIKIDQNSICAINRGTTHAEWIKQASLIIWDEAPMMSKHIFKAVDRTLRDIMEEPRYPFGGKVFVLGGDFRQCLPVIPNGSQAQVVSMCLNKIDCWEQFTILRLHTNMRVEFFRNRGDVEQARNLQEWTEYLLRVGNGEEPQYPMDHPLYPGWINAPSHLASPFNTEVEFIRSIYEDYKDMATMEEKEEYLRSTAILCPTNAKADKINDTLINSDILGEGFALSEMTQFIAVNSIVEPEYRDHYPQVLLDNYEKSGLPPNKLLLKVGCPIIMMRNYSRKNGVVNGTRLLITEIHSHSVKARILSGLEQHWGEEVLIGKVAITSTDTENFGATLKRYQFPFRVAFAMTINKSQGLTLTKVGIHLETQVFSHGQVYVAISRVGRPEGVTIYQPENDRATLNDPLPIKNCVFYEALL